MPSQDSGSGKLSFIRGNSYRNSQPDASMSQTPAETPAGDSPSNQTAEDIQANQTARIDTAASSKAQDKASTSIFPRKAKDTREDMSLGEPDEPEETEKTEALSAAQSEKADPVSETKSPSNDDGSGKPGVFGELLRQTKQTGNTIVMRTDKPSAPSSTSHAKDDSLDIGPDEPPVSAADTTETDRPTHRKSGGFLRGSSVRPTDDASVTQETAAPTDSTKDTHDDMAGTTADLTGLDVRPDDGSEITQDLSAAKDAAGEDAPARPIEATDIPVEEDESPRRERKRIAMFALGGVAAAALLTGLLISTVTIIGNKRGEELLNNQPAQEQTDTDDKNDDSNAPADDAAPVTDITTADVLSAMKAASFAGEGCAYTGLDSDLLVSFEESDIKVTDLSTTDAVSRFVVAPRRAAAVLSALKDKTYKGAKLSSLTYIIADEGGKPLAAVYDDVNSAAVNDAADSSKASIALADLLSDSGGWSLTADTYKSLIESGLSIEQFGGQEPKAGGSILISKEQPEEEPTQGTSSQDQPTSDQNNETTSGEGTSSGTQNAGDSSQATNGSSNGGGTTNNSGSTSNKNTGSSTGGSSSNGSSTSGKPAHVHSWKAQTTTKWVEDSPGHYEDKIVVDAYDEEVPDGEHVEFSDGTTSTDTSWEAISEYLSSHDVTYKLVTDYKTVHHEAKTQQVWVDATGHYETVITGYVCTSCGAKKGA